MVEYLAIMHETLDLISSTTQRDINRTQGYKFQCTTQLPFLPLLNLVVQERDEQWCLPSQSDAYTSHPPRSPKDQLPCFPAGCGKVPTVKSWASSFPTKSK